MATESSMFFRFSCRSNLSSFSRRKRCWTGGLGPSATHLPLPLTDGYTLLRARVPSQPLPQPQKRLSLICPHPHSLLATDPSPEKSQHSMLLHHFSSTAVEVEDGMCEGVTHKATRESRARWWPGIRLGPDTRRYRVGPRQQGFQPALCWMPSEAGTGAAERPFITRWMGSPLEEARPAVLQPHLPFIPPDAHVGVR